MRKIYQKYFEILEEHIGNMGEHVFFARLTVAIACIVLCMSAMGFSAYAFFTASVSSNMNQIQAANYSLSVQSPIVLMNDRGSVAADSSNPNKYTMTQPGMYDFTLIKSGNASTGYCKIKINNNENDVIVTRQIANDALSVRVEVAQETTVEFVACWGTYSSQERFDENHKMIIVDSSKNVTVVAKTDTATVSTPDTANEPVSASETTGTTQTTTPIETENVKTETDITTESTEAVDDTTSAQDTSATKTQE